MGNPYVFREFDPLEKKKPSVGKKHKRTLIVLASGRFYRGMPPTPILFLYTPGEGEFQSCSTMLSHVDMRRGYTL